MAVKQALRFSAPTERIKSAAINGKGHLVALCCKQEDGKDTVSGQTLGGISSPPGWLQPCIVCFQMLAEGLLAKENNKMRLTRNPKCTNNDKFKESSPSRRMLWNDLSEGLGYKTQQISS